MKSGLYRNKITAKKSKIHGYGVFADKNIKKGEIIEQCYFLLVRGKDKALEDIYFDVKGKDGLLLGYGSIYNHQTVPNATYTFSVKKRIATFKANSPIKKGEEIFISYGDEWFTTRKIKAKKSK